MKQTIAIVLAALLSILFLVYVTMNISANNREKSLRNAIESKIKDNKNVYTAMWEILKEQVGNIK